MTSRTPAPFQLIAATGNESPVVVEIPHAGLFLPPSLACAIVAPARALSRDADVYVDELYADAPTEGASLLVANASRFVVDLNRDEADIDADVVELAQSATHFNHGLIWRVTSDGERTLSRPLSRAELEERLDLIYRPYHRALGEELERKRAKFGVAILLAAHSMPGTGRSAAGKRGPRAYVVPGTRGRTSADARVIDAVEAHARAGGLSIAHDDPYAGGFVTKHYGRPNERIHAVQVELARRLYVDEATLRPHASNFGVVRAWCRALVARLGDVGRLLADGAGPT